MGTFDEDVNECFATFVTGDSEKELLKKKITEMDGELSFALACVEASYKDTVYYKSESESRLQSYLAQIEANRVSLAKLSQVENQRDELLETLKLKEQDLRERELANNEWANKCAELKNELSGLRDAYEGAMNDKRMYKKRWQTVDAQNANGIRVQVVSRGYKFPLGLTIHSVDSRAANATLLLDEKLPKPQRKDGAEPCGECHLKESETCCICGAIQKR